MMRAWGRFFLWGAALVLCRAPHAQVDLQKVTIDKVVLKFVTNKPSTNRCLLWFPFDANQKVKTEYDEDGNPFTRVQLRAHVRGKDCNVSFRPQESMKLVRSEENDLYFEVLVKPPTTVIEFNGFFNGPDFRDQLIFDAISESLEEVDFFTFFKKSNVYFEGRHAQFKTNNKNQSTSMLPVFGGKIGVPLPWIEHVIVDFSMFQNLGNIHPDKDIRLQYSEFSFGVNYLWAGRESMGRPQLVPSLEYRGRNLYQTYVNPSGILSGNKPYLVGQVNSPRVGLDASWFPGGLWYSWEHWPARLGLDTSFRYAVAAKIPKPSTTSQASGGLVALNAWSYSAGLQYRLGRKWALGVGYSHSSSSFPIGINNVLVKVSISNIYLRLLLLPYIVEGAE